jgi:hypothetical protein
MGGWRVPTLPNKRFEQTPRARMLTLEVIESGSSATRGALIGVQLRSDDLAV